MLTDLLSLGSRWTFVGGKGGVGKTTVAAALAVALADRDRRVLVLSTDPAHSLGDALRSDLSGEPSAVAGAAGLQALEIDPRAEHAKFLDSHHSTLIELIRRGSVLDEEDISAVSELSVPGIDELAALFRLMELGRDSSRQVVIDTAPTGHTLRLLDLPKLARGWLGALRAMEEEERAVALAFTGTYGASAASRLLDSLDTDLRDFQAVLGAPEQTRFVLVTNPEPVVLAETRRYEEALTARGIALGGIVVNRAVPPIREDALGSGMLFVPRLATDPVGVEALREFASAASEAPAVVREPSRSPEPAFRAGADYRVPTDRTLYVVGGKGGVGKTTVASALAIDLAHRLAGEILLLSIDPAGSLEDVLATPVGSSPRGVPGVPGLQAQQIAAEIAWDEFRTDLTREAERLVSGLASDAGSAASDPSTVRRWLELAPPGVDELMALLQVIDLTADGRYHAVVVDAAPTGHLLRLLELPDTALQWVRTLLRILLKYREAVGLGELAEKVLELSRDLRALQRRLQTPSTTWLAAVALPETLSASETRRLLDRLRGLGIHAGALILNRVLEADPVTVRPGIGALFSGEGAMDLPRVGTPDLGAGPVGVPELAAFARSWRMLETKGAVWTR